MTVQMQQDGAFSQDFANEGNNFNILTELQENEEHLAEQHRIEVDSHLHDVFEGTNGEEYEEFIVRLGFVTSVSRQFNLIDDLIERLR